MFVNYRCKDKKSVCLLSTMQVSPVSDGEKKKPAVVQFYNQNKIAVDIVNQMVRIFSTRCATRRWPVGLLACGVMFWTWQPKIIYKKSTGKKSKTVYIGAGRGIEIAAHISSKSNARTTTDNF